MNMVRSETALQWNAVRALVGPALSQSRWVATEDAGLRSHGLSPRALQRALAFMDANIGKRVTLAAIAGSAAVSRFHFARLFRVTTGHSPMEFLVRTRIDRSKYLLARGDISICEVAAELGFCDQSHFTRTFRRLTGMSPREYIRSMQHANTLN
jgi:transcriptional regulator GlxA family with amidase domain